MSTEIRPNIEMAIDAGARHAYAQRCSTQGPYRLQEYASPAIMQQQHEMARNVIEGYLMYMAKCAVREES